jgi:hypothetical protein
MQILSEVVSFGLYLCLGAPFCLVLHELGHAAAILMLSRQRAVFQFGARGRRSVTPLSRISLVLHPDPHALFFCRYRVEDIGQLTKSQDAWITLGGPISSLLFTVLFGVIWWRAGGQGDPWSGLTLINLFNLMIAGVPGNYPRLLAGEDGIANDGLQSVQLLRPTAR